MYFPLSASGFRLRVFLLRGQGRAPRGAEWGSLGEEGAGERHPKGEMPRKEGRSPSYTKKPLGAPGCPFSAALHPALHPALHCVLLHPRAAESLGWHFSLQFPAISTYVASRQGVGSLCDREHLNKAHAWTALVNMLWVELVGCADGHPR